VPGRRARPARDRVEILAEVAGAVAALFLGDKDLADDVVSKSVSNGDENGPSDDL
jgi:hypothetical protein